MPTAYVKKMAKKHGVSVKKAESEWADAKSIAKKQYGKNSKKLWGTVTNIFKNKMNAHYREGFISSFNEYISEGYTKQTKHMKIKFLDFLNEDISENSEMSETQIVKNLIDDYNLTETDAMSLLELHNQIINEKDPKIKDSLINHMFTELNIQDDDYDDLKTLIYSWCYSPEEVKMKKLKDFSSRLFLKEYKNKVTYNDSVIIENFYNKVFHKAMQLKMDTDLIEISSDILCPSEEVFQESEKKIDIYYKDEEVWSYVWI